MYLINHIYGHCLLVIDRVSSGDLHHRRLIRLIFRISVKFTVSMFRRSILLFKGPHVLVARSCYPANW